MAVHDEANNLINGITYTKGDPAAQTVVKANRI